MPPFNLENYETVEDRLAKFWADHPDGRMLTSIHYYDDSRILVRAEAFFDRDDARPVATGYAEELRGASPVNRTSHAENAETSAIGRALANCGYAAKGARPSREEMAKVARGAVAAPVLTADFMTKFRGACEKAGVAPEDVAQKAGLDLHGLKDDDLPRLRDAFKSLQEQAKVAQPAEKPLIATVEEVTKAFNATEIQPEVKNKSAKATNPQLGKIRGMLNNVGISERGAQADLVSEILHRKIEKLDSLTRGEADEIIKTLLLRRDS